MKKFLFFLSLMSLGLVIQPVLVPHARAEEAAKSGEGGKEEGKKEEGGKDKKSEDVTGGRFAGDPVFVHLAPMVMPVISDSGVEQLVTIVIDIEVSSFETADKIHANMPRVMDALMRHLYGGLGQGSLRKGKLVDVSKVKSKAVAALKEVLGEDGIKNVLVQGVSQRML